MIRTLASPIKDTSDNRVIDQVASENHIAAQLTMIRTGSLFWFDVMRVLATNRNIHKHSPPLSEKRVQYSPMNRILPLRVAKTPSDENIGQHLIAVVDFVDVKATQM